MICYHFSTHRTFNDYYIHYIKGYLKRDFLTAVSYNRFVELMPRVFFKMMLLMKLYAFGKCTGITFVASTMIPVCHNVRRYFNKVFSCLAKNGKGAMGWCHGFKLHLLCNDSGEVITFCLTGANVGIAGYGRCLQRFCMGRSLPTGDMSIRNYSRVCSIKVSNSFLGSRLK